MKSVPSLRGALWVAVLSTVGSTGCITNHHYYTGVPGCPPGTMPISTQAGTSICDVPSGQVVVSSSTTPAGSAGSTVIVPAPPSTVGSAANPPRVVISQPSSTYGPGLSRFKWRRPDPENVATMRTEGGLDDGATTYK